MTMLAEIVDAVIGGDTHRDTHALEMLAPNGTTLSTTVIDNDEDGYATAIAWIAELAPGPRVVLGLEGTRSYGIGLARAATQAGLTVVEVERPRRQERRRGKSDPIDAHLAALQVLRMNADRLPTPRADGDREALRILLSARREMTTSKTRQTNRLRALLLSGDDTDRGLARGKLTQARLQSIARRRGRSADTVEQAVRRAETRRLALAIDATMTELVGNKEQLATIVESFAPGLLDRPGVGPVSAGQAIVTWSHHGRCRNDAAFAALAGASPVPASSGRTVRHRLNRGGDRQLNRALHDIAKTRWRHDPRTVDYVARRRAAGKPDREIRRTLKRYIARELFRALEATQAA
ncbi:IS110 family transposase [Jatrophihabitans sp. GAS493]|uniref:IS110 family transposase n=1 Tax=Jatrophihabitans sp. GAS493 TaxID=1907575 RepID=UPI000BB682EC|nr:IS110 family transposase [Jatrophihabitans sp. GAS493]